MAIDLREYFDGKLDTIKTDFLIQDNKTQKIEYQQDVVQLDNFMV